MSRNEFLSEINECLEIKSKVRNTNAGLKKTLITVIYDSNTEELSSEPKIKHM